MSKLIKEHKLHKLRNPCFLMTTDNQRLSDSLFCVICVICVLLSVLTHLLL
ncbi:hypothetical protein HMPREF9446_02080 [Bacteroides fluxus YIT 12057]|uniref:Uncharacterized protein n=1 Tax=Bacteroides fluxus YIT 12057 TaxID=763034 RepID=F3PTL2_9BACE|nr:hypothetical protein HMPREF9446_02080 [Bacteroides fluxus YIT 12057]